MPNKINKRIDLTKAASYRLSIQAYLNGFSFAVLDDAAATCLQLHHHAFPLSTDYNELYSETVTWCNKFLPTNVPFVQVHCSFCAPSFTLVPGSVFTPEKAAQILGAMHPINDLDEVYYYTLLELDAVCIYAVPNAITTPILKVFKETRFYSVAITLIRCMMSLSGHTRILSYFHNGYLYLVLMKEQQLLLCNAYQAPQHQTALYFLFLALQQWQLNPESIHLYMAGTCSKELVQLFSRYFPRIVSLAETKIAGIMPHPFPPCASSEAL